MSNDNTPDHVRYYELQSRLSAGVFGESYAITAIQPDGVDTASAIAEYIVLTTRGEPTRLYGRLRTQYGTLGGGLGDFRSEDLHDLAKIEAIAALGQALSTRAQTLSRPDIEFIPMELKRIERRPLVGAWMRNKWHTDIRWIASNVYCPELQRYCQAITRNIMTLEPPKDD